jgi:hypothetical protein
MVAVDSASRSSPRRTEEPKRADEAPAAPDVESKPDAARAGEDRVRAHLLDRGSGEALHVSAPSISRRAFTLADSPVAAESPSEAPASGEGFAIQPDGSYRFDGTAGDDGYTVTQSSGDLTITNDATGDSYTLPSADVRAGVRIFTHGGDDRVTIDDRVRADLEIHAGGGNDAVLAGRARGDLAVHGGAGDDTIITGEGNDDIDGGDGHDFVLAGDGNDLVRGGAGDDGLLGQAGDDRIWGGDGDDRLLGGAGRDFATGGDGADRVYGGTGSDAVYGDAADHVDGGKDADQIVVADGATTGTADAGDVVATYDPAEVDAWLTEHPEIQIDGPDEFADRVRADLGVMLTTAQGSGLLNELATALADEGETLSITQVMGSARYYPATNEAESSSGVWNYEDGTLRTPTTALFHELVHGYQDLVSGSPLGSTEYTNGDATENDELQAVGLRWIGLLGLAGVGTFSENAFRRELGLPERTRYGDEEGDPSHFVW